MQLIILSTLLPLLPVALAKTTTINVGEGGLKFTPDSVTAAEGDVLEFHYYPQNHSVAQSTFDKPCTANATGIWSGFMPVSGGEGQSIFSVTINNTDTIWLYCSQGEHCKGGMAMVVNEPQSGNTLANYKTAASKVTRATSPEGEYNLGILSAVNNSSSVANGTSTSTTAASSGTATGGPSGTSSAAASSSTTGAAVKLNVAGWGVLGAAGLIVGGMV